MRAVMYLRVSTEEQAESGLGLEAQEHACRAWCDRHGATPVGPLADEGISGATPIDECPALVDALNLVGPGAALLVAKRDRLGRSRMKILLLEQIIERKGGRLASAAGEGTGGDPDDPMEMLMRGIVDLFSEYERLIIKMRTKMALAQLKARGVVLGSARPECRANLQPAAAARGRALGAGATGKKAAEHNGPIVARARALALEGRSLAAIARELTAAGYRGRGGGELGPPQLGRLLGRAGVEPWAAATKRQRMRRRLQRAGDDDLNQ